jgi:hypothetical protein
MSEYEWTSILASIILAWLLFSFLRWIWRKRR